MKYNIYCKYTGKLLATYINESTLKGLDLNRCYYIAINNDSPKTKEKPRKTEISSSTDYPCHIYYSTYSNYDSSSCDSGSSSISSSCD